MTILAAAALALVGMRAERLAARMMRQARFMRELGGVEHRVRIGEYDGVVILPSGRKHDASASWVWFAPAGGGGHPSEAYKWLFQNLLGHGISLAGLDIGDSYGNEKGRAAYSEFYKLARERYGLPARPCLLGQSRGGLMLYNWAEENADLVGCIGAIFPVTDLESWPGLENAQLQAAYGLTEAGLRSGLARINPIDRIGGLAIRQVPVFHVHGDADDVAPLLQNTFEFARRDNEAGGRAEFAVLRGKGHEGGREFFESRELLQFLLTFGNSLTPVRAAIPYSERDRRSDCIWENSRWAPRPPCKICFEGCALPVPGTITKIEYRCEGAGCSNSQNPSPGGGANPAFVLSPDRRSFTWARRWTGPAPIKDIYTIYFVPEGGR